MNIRITLQEFGVSRQEIFSYEKEDPYYNRFIWVRDGFDTPKERNNALKYLAKEIILKFRPVDKCCCNCWVLLKREI